jgi:putative ABC transport system permease protein
MRTAISVGALITAMALFVALVIMVHSFRGTVALWAQQTLSGDLYVRAQMAGVNQYRDPLPEQFVKKLQTLGPSLALLPYRRIYLRHREIPYQFDALDFEVFQQYATFLFVKGDAETVMPKLISGEGVMVSEVFANQTRLGVGQRFHAHIEGMTFNHPILAIVRDYRTRGGAVFYSLKHFQEKKSLSPRLHWSGVRIYLTDRNQDLEAAAAELRQMILRCCVDNHNVEFTLGGELRRAILRIFDETFAITTVLLLIALVVAALGITTTLTVLVLERRTELNTLMAVGSSFGQIRSMIFWEAILMVMTGEFVGLLCGFLLSYLLVFVINLQSFGWTFLYRVDWVALIGSLPLILATALVASLPASQMVFHQPPAMILREQ